ncbi:staphylopine uptake ABC transporter ATP-binding protein CntD [Jeotgalibacillus proteolyticus]|uniref:Nickel import ATP-binding protein NikD n=1 Tax=Jeotgalibacillus proteolyticus TaxID=2082395 RepID=A0A2S5GBM1_9BACL|nr:ABC transporter ATP-binding protein [Jeotgalibacillus proteolyticus]PPA70389.1 nickel import ATP-binding protein NikD [Jeotgalibacillus proteolyticus]
MTSLLEVRNLKIWDSRTEKIIVPASTFQLTKGSCLAIVGESGSGKSVTCKAIMRLNNSSLQQTGEIWFKGENLNTLSEKQMRKKRGKQLCLIIQNGMSAFDPSCLIGVFAREVLTQHFDWGRKKIEEEMINAMESVLLQEPSKIMRKYPHQLSGGMLQRIMIALAIVLKPEIIIADEPTTALDVISQYEVLEQFKKLRETLGCSMIFVSHDLGVVKKIADEVLVMKDGEIVERGSTKAVFLAPKHEYTRFLVSTRLAVSEHFNHVMKGDAVLAER